MSFTLTANSIQHIGKVYTLVMCFDRQAYLSMRELFNEVQTLS